LLLLEKIVCVSLVWATLWFNKKIENISNYLPWLFCLQIEETLDLAKIIEKTGVSALIVHGRTKEERPRHKNRNDFIRKIAETLSIPVIAK
jgi:2,4-dienoyl-CoA reductase-like NADH-dependent reductase (Old Yellow Enzyme family)